MVADLPFSIEWRGPADPRDAGAQVMEHIVPMFRKAGYEKLSGALKENAWRGTLAVSGLVDTRRFVPRARATRTCSPPRRHRQHA